MVMIRRISPLGLLLFYVCSGYVLVGGLSVAGAAPGSGRDGGRITVTVANQTTGQPLSGQEITLQRHLGEQTAAQLRGVTDNTGRFSFVSLPIDSAHYVVTTRYLGVDYMTEPLALQDSSATRDARLDVYNTTTRDDGILVEAHHLIIDVQPKMLDITEILVFHNNGKETFVGTSDSLSGAKNGIRLSVPAANILQFQPMSSGIEEASQGPLYTLPMPPGPAQVVYTYSVDRHSIKNLFSERVEYDTGRVQVLITPSNLTVTGTGLTNNGVRHMGEKDFLLLSNPNGLPKGGVLEIRFPGTFVWQDMVKWGALGLVALIVIAGISTPYLLKRRKVASTQAAPPRRPTRAEREKTQRQHQQLIQAIADLDDRYEAGEIDRAAYDRQRSDLKNRAAKALKQMTGDTDE